MHTTVPDLVFGLEVIYSIASRLGNHVHRPESGPKQRREAGRFHVEECLPTEDLDGL